MPHFLGRLSEFAVKQGDEDIKYRGGREVLREYPLIFGASTVSSVQKRSHRLINDKKRSRNNTFVALRDCILIFFTELAELLTQKFTILVRIHVKIYLIFCNTCKFTFSFYMLQLRQFFYLENESFCLCSMPKGLHFMSLWGATSPNKKRRMWVIGHNTVSMHVGFYSSSKVLAICS